MTKLAVRHSRLGLALFLPLAISLACFFASGQAMAAAAKSAAPHAPCATCHKVGDFSVPYDAGWTFVSHHLSECMVFKATGHMSYTLWYGTIGHAAEYFWTDQSLNDPTLNLKVYDYSKKFRDCAGRAYLVEATIAQHWSGYSCSFNPSITISGPWGVGVSGWPDCGNREQAHYAKTYHGKNWTYTQYNSGSKSRFADYSHLDTFVPPCYGVFVSGDFNKTANVSDSFGEGNTGADSHKVCLSKK